MSREKWIQDAKERLLKNAKATDAVEKELIYAYEQAAYEMESKISTMYGRYAKENKLTLAEADKMISGQEYSHWKKSIEQYLAESKTDSRTLLELNTLSAKSRISRQEQLLSQIYMEMGRLAGETEAKMSGLLQGIVRSNYLQECYSLQKGMGVGFRVAGLNQDLIKNIVSHTWSGKRFSERVWENTDQLAVMAKREITLGMIKGSSVQEMAKGINDVMGKGRYAAQRLVRTESSHFAGEAQKIAYEECGIKRYEFLGGGCDLCQGVNGVDFALEEAQEGINYPPIHPNCKCTTIAKFDKSMFDFKNREPLEKDISKKEWEEKYVDTGLSAKVGGSDGIELHEEKKLLEVIDANDRGVVKSRIDEYTSKIREEEIENAIVITKEGKVYQCFGTKDKVFPDYDLGDKLIGTDVTHNHPQTETHYSFSSDDIGLFLNHKLNTLTGTDYRYEYRVTRTAETIEDSMDVIYHKFKTDYRNQVWERAWNGEIDPDLDTYHEIVKLFAKDYKFNYERRSIN